MKVKEIIEMMNSPDEMSKFKSLAIYPSRDTIITLRAEKDNLLDGHRIKEDIANMQVVRFGFTELITTGCSAPEITVHCYGKEFYNLEESNDTN